MVEVSVETDVEGLEIHVDNYFVNNESSYFLYHEEVLKFFNRH